MEHRAIVFTDGSSLGNPGPGGWGAIVALPSGAVRELGGREDRTTNNRMELTAAIEALEVVPRDIPLTVHTDSSYVINGITTWVRGWQRNGWMTGAKEPVVNRDLWERLLAATRGRNLEWRHVRGHRGIAGNERVDEIATSFAANKPPRLFAGPRVKYAHDLSTTAVPEGESGARATSSARAKKKAYSYVSLVDAVARRHATWPECEKRVRGQSGARYKKALSADEERAILRAWGVDPDQVK